MIKAKIVVNFMRKHCELVYKLKDCYIFKEIEPFKPDK